MTGAIGFGGRAKARKARAAGDDAFAPDALDRHARAILSALVLMAAGITAFALDLFLDGDTGWHLGAGRWIIAHRDVPLTDPFSHTFAGTPWTAHEWLAEIIMVGADAVAGWAGLAALFALTAALTLAMMAREAFRFLPARWAILFVAVVASLLVSFVLARPHVLAWPLLAGWTLVLLRAREEGRAPSAFAGLIMLVWANLHASYIVAFGLAGLFALESLIERPRDRGLLGRWVTFGLVAAGSALLTPLGPSHLIYPFQVSGMEALSIIGEWRRSTPTSDPLFFLAVAGLVMLVARRWREVPPLRLLLLAGLTVMALLHARHQMLLAIVGGLVVLPCIRGVAAEPSARLNRTSWLLPGVALIAAFRLVVPYGFVESSAYPLSLMARIPAELRSQPMFNEYSQGGPLIMLGMRPYIDGRADMYGDAFTFRARAIARGDMRLFREDAQRFGLSWAILQTEDGLAARLGREPGWRELMRDRHAVIFIREPVVKPSDGTR